jgi:hypothetical protein
LSRVEPAIYGVFATGPVMSLCTRIFVLLLCGIFALGNLEAAASLCYGDSGQSESSDSGGDPESENEADSLELALPCRHDLLAQVTSSAASQLRFRVAEREPSFTPPAFLPTRLLSVGSGTGGPLRC